MYSSGMDNNGVSTLNTEPIEAEIPDSKPKPFIDRYFQLYCDQKQPFLETLSHSNGIVLVRLNPKFKDFIDCSEVSISFKVTEKLDRRKNTLSGKKKRNAQWLDHTSPLCILKYNDQTHKVNSPVRGKLLQINHKIDDGKNLKDFLLSKEGWLAILLPNKRESGKIFTHLKKS